MNCLERNFNYHLKINYDYDKDPVGIKNLVGIFAGIFKTLPVYGHIVFLSYPKKGINSFQELSKAVETYAFKPGEEHTLEQIEVVKLLKELKEQFVKK